MKKFREIAFVTFASLLFLGGFLAVVYYDKPHGDIGSGYAPNDVKTTIGETEGTMQIPQLPAGLYVFGVGQSAEMEFIVANEDKDNDIDTIVVTIPGSTVTNSSYAWGESGEEHQWNATIETGKITFAADTDYPGLNHGGSAQYDAAGNDDDALDYDTAANESESITVTVAFTAPLEEGFKVGDNAINLEIGDLQTEGANVLETFEPFPYPYIVGDNGGSFIVMILDSSAAGLGVNYGGTVHFSSTRASGFKTFDHGMEYVTDEGKTVAVVEKPSEGTIVKPVILPASGSIGTFSLDIFDFTITDVSTGTVGTNSVVTGYSETPIDPTQVLDLDIDSDGEFNAIDEDIDGDTYPNDEDPSPYNPSVFNTPPTGALASVDKQSAEEGSVFTLSGSATDADSTTLTYTWTCAEVPSWTQTGKVVTVVAGGQFLPGESYTFTVTVSDGISSKTTTDDITVLINKKAEPTDSGISPILVIAIIAVVVVIIVILVYFFIVRGKEEGEEEQPMEMGPEPVATMEAPTLQAETGAADIEDTEEEVKTAPVASVVKAPAPPAAPATASAVPDESEDVQELEQLIEDLEKTEEEISDLCPECGSPLGPQDSSCPSCGTEFELALECPNCGTVVEDKSANCPSCGIQFI